MGFRLANMMPNVWFYKLKDMSSTTHHRAGKKKKNHQSSMPQDSKKSLQISSPPPTTPEYSKAPQQPKLQQNRSTCYISSRPETDKPCYSPLHSKLTHSHFHLDSPRKSMKRSRRKPCKSSPNNNKTHSVSNGCNCRVLKDSELPSVQSPGTCPNQRDYFIDGEFDSIPSWSSSSSCTLITSATEIIIDIASKNAKKSEKLEDFDTLELPPIHTKPVKQHAEQVKFVDKKVDSYKSVSPAKQQQRKSNAKRSPTGLQRLRIRANSPRLSSYKDDRKSNVRQIKTKGISECFAVVKSSLDPQKDFTDSMVEMIVENNIRKSKDLEELLACYLSLNSNEYHDVIVKVFQQIWFDLTRKLDCKM